MAGGGELRGKKRGDGMIVGKGEQKEGKGRNDRHNNRVRGE